MQTDTRFTYPKKWKAELTLTLPQRQKQYMHKQRDKKWTV